jgi:N-methylhydantoinase A/oxoprolinase/acetone carboxylase beta subunit
MVANLIKVGPKSRAAPGPICYGLGGTEATIADADEIGRKSIVKNNVFVGAERISKKKKRGTTLSRLLERRCV